MGEKSISENSIQEDPNLTPFQNSARSRFGYGNIGGLNGPVPYHRTVRPTTTINEVPTVTQTTTQATTTTTSPTTTTTEAVASPEEEPESGADESDLFTGDSALVPSSGPTGDGYGPPIFPGGAIPPPVPAVGLGGAAAGKSPYAAMIEPTENPPTTVKPSALLHMLNKADQGINQAITHFEQKSPLETAAIDILEVALGSQKLDSQAKLLGHVDRTIGLDNLQRIQRWANTAGAMDVFKEEVVKFLKNFEPPEDVFPTLPPQLEYLFKSSGR
ncbi:hypothetical protein TELCIR_04693 [Teladorsagia circumcincta]|uniref:Uncharacterized protein n=1 Tax=Teladorsagia circumcincta TaxID=45464 RepID=A0A2G9USV3_TELCI|nr:hypothetical protein TELCIR_04693 [Teladorsagia circumcincta]